LFVINAVLTSCDQFNKMVENMQLQHEEDLAIQQQRFIEEKFRLQKEAARRISEVSKNAHDEAIRLKKLH